MRTSDLVAVLQDESCPWGLRVYDAEPKSLHIPQIIVYPVSRKAHIISYGRSQGTDSLSDALFQVDLYEKRENGPDESVVYERLAALKGIVEVQGVVYQHESYGVRCIFTIHCLGA